MLTNQLPWVSLRVDTLYINTLIPSISQYVDTLSLSLHFSITITSIHYISIHSISPCVSRRWLLLLLVLLLLLLVVVAVVSLSLSLALAWPLLSWLLLLCSFIIHGAGHHGHLRCCSGGRWYCYTIIRLMPNTNYHTIIGTTNTTTSYDGACASRGEGGLLVFKLSPYKTSKSPSQPGGSPPPLPLGFAGL